MFPWERHFEINRVYNGGHRFSWKGIKFMFYFS